jgi:hypothetical protein
MGYREHEQLVRTNFVDDPIRETLQQSPEDGSGGERPRQRRMSKRILADGIDRIRNGMEESIPQPRLAVFIPLCRFVQFGGRQRQVAEDHGAVLRRKR